MVSSNCVMIITRLYNTFMHCRPPSAFRFLFIVFFFLLSCTPQLQLPTQTSLWVYRFDPPAFVEFSEDFKQVREIPFSVPLNCGLFDVLPAPIGKYLLIELNCP